MAKSKLLDKIKARLINMNDVMTGSRVYEIFLDKFKDMSTEEQVSMAARAALGDDSQFKALLNKVGDQVTLEAKQNIKEEPIYKAAIISGSIIAVGLFAAGYYTAKYKRRKK